MDTSIMKDSRWRIVFAESKAERDAVEEAVLKEYKDFSKRRWKTWLWEPKKGLFVKKKTVGQALGESFEPLYAESLTKRSLKGFGCGHWYDLMCDRLSPHQRDIACQLSAIFVKNYCVILRDDTDEDTLYSQKFLMWFFKDRDPKTTRVIWITHKLPEFLAQPMAPDNLTREYKIENEDYEGIRVADVFDGVYAACDGQLKELNAAQVTEAALQSKSAAFEEMKPALTDHMLEGAIDKVLNKIAPLVQARCVPAMSWLSYRLPDHKDYYEQSQNLLFLLGHKYGSSEALLRMARDYEDKSNAADEKQKRISMGKLAYSYYRRAYENEPDELIYLFALTRFCYSYQITAKLETGEVEYTVGPEQAVKYTKLMLAYRDRHPEDNSVCELNFNHLRRINPAHYARAQKEYGTR